MRRINELIWHCSATPEGRHVTVETIRKWHTDKGWSDIGYHKVVYLDGSVHDGRPMKKIGAHVKGHNTGSLGYCYIGGVAKDAKTAKDTRTPKQKQAMWQLTRDAIDRFGVTKISGHNQYANKACPSFSVPSDPTIQEAIAGRGGTPRPAKAPPAKAKARKAEKATVAALLVGAAGFLALKWQEFTAWVCELLPFCQ